MLISLRTAVATAGGLTLAALQLLQPSPAAAAGKPDLVVTKVLTSANDPFLPSAVWLFTKIGALIGVALAVLLLLPATNT